MSNRYNSSPSWRAVAIRLILIIVIPLLIIMLAWLVLGKDRDQLNMDQLVVQPLDIPKQSNNENQQAVGSALEKNISKQTKKENSKVKPKSEPISDPTANKKSNLADLPPLGNSDGIFRKDILNLSSGFSPWLSMENIIKTWMIATNDFSQNLRPYKHFRQFKLSQPFQVATDDSGMYITEQSYQRYNGLASAVRAVNVGSSLKLYEKYRPLLQQVFATFDYPEQYHLEDVINKAASSILQAPILEGKIRVIKPTVYYKFSEQKIEMLSPVQKQMIRMGPENTRIIQTKLRQFIEGLANR